MWLSIWKAVVVIMLICGTEGEGLPEDICDAMQRAVIADAEGYFGYGDDVTCEETQLELGYMSNG